MNIEKINPNINYVYHYTSKKNVKKILNDKAIKSKDQYVFFTESLHDSVIAFEREMMQENRPYIDVNGFLRKREKCNKSDYCILKIPYINDNEFYKFNFENQKEESIYTLSVAHKGEYKFKNAKILEFPKPKSKKLNVLSKTAAVAIATGMMLFPYNVYAADWLDTDNYDTGWYISETVSDYSISNAKELAGLAHLVNSENKTFAGKTINITADIDLTENTWVTIDDIFQGTICGSHRIILNCFDGEFAENKNINNVVYQLTVLENNTALKDVTLLSPYTVEVLKNTTGTISVFLNNEELSNDTSLLELDLKEDDIIDVFNGQHLYIQNSKGVKTPLYYESSDSIERIIEIYSGRINIPKEKIVLKYNGKELDTKKVLADYNIQNHSIINAYEKFDITTSVVGGKGSITSSKDTAIPGETIKITLNPNSEYELAELTVNGTDKTEEVQNNELTVTCGEEDINIKVSYKLKAPKNSKGNADPTEKNEDQQKNASIEIPKTGTGNNIFTYVITFFASVIGIVICKFKKVTG